MSDVPGMSDLPVNEKRSPAEVPLQRLRSPIIKNLEMPGGQLAATTDSVLSSTAASAWAVAGAGEGAAV